MVPPPLGEVLAAITRWIKAQGFESVAELRGRVSALEALNPAGLERANYVNILDSDSSSPGVMV